MSKKITILGTNILKLQTGNAVANRMEYTCANSMITNGLQPTPVSLEDCYFLYPDILKIARELGVGTTYSLPAGFGVTGNTSGVLSCGISGSSGFPTGPSGGLSLIFSSPARESAKVEEYLGRDWLGCFWPDPLASFSSDCPRYGSMFETYLKYRLGCATFWATPPEIPVDRQQFIESVKDLVEITVVGDFSQRPGDIVYIKIDNATGLVTQNESLSPESIKSGYYYIMRAKNVIKNDGGHTTILSLSKITRQAFYPPYRESVPYDSYLDASLSSSLNN